MVRIMKKQDDENVVGLSLEMDENSLDIYGSMTTLKERQCTNSISSECAVWESPHYIHGWMTVPKYQVL